MELNHNHLTAVEVTELLVLHDVGPRVRVNLGQDAVARVETEGERVAHPRLLVQARVGTVVNGDARDDERVVTRDVLVHLRVKLAQQRLCIVEDSNN